MDEKLLDIEEAAEFLGLAEKTLYSYTSARKIPHVKIGGRVLFPKSMLWEWVQDHIVTPATK